MLLDYTQASMSTYTADCSGVASALYELGGMTVIHDASGCNSTYATHDEPRWTSMPSAVYISALLEMDAVLGNEDKVVDDIVKTVRDITPAFVAIAGTPIPTMTGVDLKSIASRVETQTGTPSFALATNSMRPYSIGAAMSWIELARRFTDTTVCSPSRDINLMGVTPLDFSMGTLLDSLFIAADRAGFSVNACWAMRSTLEDLSRTLAARVNVVVSASGLPLAQFYEARFGMPYVVGLPIGDLAPRWEQAIRFAITRRRSVPLGDFLGKDPGGSRIAVIGEPLQAACVAAANNLTSPGSTRALSVLPTLGADAPILMSDLSEDTLREQLRASTVMLGDPLFNIIAKEADCRRCVSFPHEACSGRWYTDHVVDTINGETFRSLQHALCSTNLSE